MIVVFRNYFRNKMVNLTATSIKHFIPRAKIHCLTLYKQSPSEYNDQEPLHDYINEIQRKTQFVNSNNILDHVDSTKTSGYQNGDNAKYFVEGYNYIMEEFKDVDEKVLILAEDHFFTTGHVIRELIEIEFDLAYAPWDTFDDANGSILCLRPKRLQHLFPLRTDGRPIEVFLRDELVRKTLNRYAIMNRLHSDYFGDGKYTNSSVEIEHELKKARIL